MSRLIFRLAVMESDLQQQNVVALRQKAELVGQVWIAGLASANGDFRLNNSINEPTDINEALYLVRYRTLNNEKVSLNDLSTMLLGLCRLIRDKTQKLSVTASRQEDDWAQAVSAVIIGNEGATEEGRQEISHCVQSNDLQNRVNRKVRHECSSEKTRWQKKQRKLRCDQRTQLTTESEVQMDVIDTRAKVVPDFGLDTALKMTLYQENVHLMTRPVWEISSKLAYLFARNANNNKSSDKRSGGSLPCDSSNGKRARWDCAAQEKIKHLSEQHDNKSSLSALAYHCVNHRIRRQEDEDETCLDTILDLPCSSEHYLPVRWRHMMLPRVDGEIAEFGDARATSSIRSIIFAHHCLKTRPAKEYPTTASHSTEANWNENGVQERVLSLLVTPSHRNRLRVFDLESLIQASSRVAVLTKQVVASHFVALLDLVNQGIITLMQSQNSSLRDNVHKIYCVIKK